MKWSGEIRLTDGSVYKLNAVPEEDRDKIINLLGERPGGLFGGPPKVWIDARNGPLLIDRQHVIAVSFSPEEAD